MERSLGPMNKLVQILLLCSIVPVLAAPRGDETLEERKKRIMRKYLRETGTITQSEFLVPSDLPEEDERVLASEERGEVTEQFQAHEGSAMGALPPRRPPPQARATDSNWLLQDMGEEEVEESTNPYGESASSDYWSSWNEEAKPRERSAYETDRRSRFDDRFSSSRFEDQRATDGTTTSRFGTPRESSTYSGTTTYGDSNRGGRSPYGTSMGTELGGSRSVYGARPENGLLNTPYPGSSTRDRSTETQRGSAFGENQGYQPYKSPYETQREQRAQGWNNSLRSGETEAEFERPNNYQQWKDRNRSNTWDPTSDDAYSNELMPKSRR